MEIMTWYLLDIVGKQKFKDDELKMSEKVSKILNLGLVKDNDLAYNNDTARESLLILS